VAERVRALGWKQVEIINSDLGSSAGIASAQREGFERVLSWVALGEVGIVGSREVSRLSRMDKDWCRLLEYRMRRHPGPSALYRTTGTVNTNCCPSSVTFFH
jgi:DNA invertase Pin-like site-specific DNA recombinase